MFAVSWKSSDKWTITKPKKTQAKFKWKTNLWYKTNEHHKFTLHIHIIKYREMYAVRIWWSWKFFGTPKGQSWGHDRNVKIYWWISKLTNVFDPLNFLFPLKCLYFVTVYSLSALLILCRNIGQNSWEVTHPKKNFIFVRFVFEPFFQTFFINFIFSKTQNVF